MSLTAVAKSSGKAGAAPEAAEAPEKKSKKKLVIILVVALLVLGGGAYKFLMPSSGPTGPVPGKVVPLDAIQINLAGDHYLRIGVALQLTDAAAEADGSKALDATIDEFSGRSMADVESPVKRRQMKAALVKQLEHLYEGEVMGVYFTEFVTQ